MSCFFLSDKSTFSIEPPYLFLSSLIVSSLYCISLSDDTSKSLLSMYALMSCDTSIIRLSTSCKVSHNPLRELSHSEALSTDFMTIPSISLILSSLELSSISAPDSSLIIFW